MFDKLIQKADEFLTNKIKSIIESSGYEKESDLAYATLPEPKRNELLAISFQRKHTDLVPTGIKGVAMDACCNSFNEQTRDIYTIRQPLNDIIYTHFATQGFIGFQACAILTQNWLINKACSLPPKDAMMPDYQISFQTAGDADEMEQVDKDLLVDIKTKSDDKKKFNIKGRCKIFAEKKRQFGQSLAYPIIDGVDYSLPFNLDAIKPNTYKGMSVVDPVWYSPELDSDAVSNPESLRFFKPTYFLLPNGTKVHYSWALFSINGEVPDILKSTYRFGGYPIPQLIYERAYAAEKVANEAPMLAQSKRLLVADINTVAYLTNPEETISKLKALAQFRDNWGVMTKRPGDSVQQIDTSLTDLDEVIMTQYQLTAAAAGIPATKLLETQPKGFDSTGDYEDDQYKMTLASIQEDDFIPFLEMHYACLAMSEYGRKIDFNIHFDEIDTPTEKERAEINSINAQTYATLLNIGAVSPEEVRDVLIKDDDSGFDDLTDELPEEDINFGDFEDETEQYNQGQTTQL